MAEMKQLLMLDSNKILCDEDRYWQSRLSGPTGFKLQAMRFRGAPIDSVPTNMQYSVLFDKVHKK